MPPPNNPLVCKVAMIFARDTRTFVNTFHVAAPAPWVAADLANLALLFETWWTNYQKLAAPAVIALTQIQVRKLDPANPLAYDLPVNPPIQGSKAPPTLPGSVTATQSWRTGLAGRKYRGRTYFPGFIESDVGEDDRLNSPTVTLLGNAALQLLSAIAANAWKLVVFRKADNGFQEIISFIIENIVDNQRRRLPARGR